MLLAFWIYAQAVAQAIVNQYVVSSLIKFILAIIIASLSGIPLVMQLSILLGELSVLPWKYWIKLPLHRLIMSMLGDEHGPAANLAVHYYCPRGFGYYAPSVRGRFRLSITYLAHFFAKLFGHVTFDDAFSGLYTVRNVSMEVRLIEEHEFRPLDSFGRKVISKWKYSRNIRRAIPMILRDLALKRKELLDQKEPQEHQQQREEDLLTHWVPTKEGQVEWDELFKREENLRWEVLRRSELTRELFKLENLKLELKRIKQEDTNLALSIEFLKLLSLERKEDRKCQSTQRRQQQVAHERSERPDERPGEQQEERLHGLEGLDRLKETHEVSEERELKEDLKFVKIIVDKVEKMKIIHNRLRRWLQSSKELYNQEHGTYSEWELEWAQRGPHQKEKREWEWARERELRRRRREPEREGEGEAELAGDWNQWAWEWAAEWAGERVREQVRERAWERTRELERNGYVELEWIRKQTLELDLELNLMKAKGEGERTTEVKAAEEEREELGLEMELDLEQRLLKHMKRLPEMALELLSRRQLNQLRRTEEGEQCLERLRQHLEELKERLRMLDGWVQRLQGNVVTEATQTDESVKTKVVRHVRLQARLTPLYVQRKIMYSITATGSQESYISNLYRERFIGLCETWNAAELFKLMEILDDNTFLVKTQNVHDKQSGIVPCETLKHFVISILKDGKKLDAYRHNGRKSYV